MIFCMYNFPLSNYYFTFNYSAKETKKKSCNGGLLCKFYKTKKRKGEKYSKATWRENGLPSKTRMYNGKDGDRVMKSYVIIFFYFCIKLWIYMFTMSI